MLFEILTLFPEALEGYLASSILGRARAAGLVEVRVTNVRDFATDKHRTADDRPYGGGAGMVMKPEPLAKAIRKVLPGRVILASPKGRPFDQAKAGELAEQSKLILVCGRYEGVDQRLIDLLVDEEVSVGDYVLTGGELPALIILDATARLIPGVVGGENAVGEDSFSEGLLEYPHYTRPRLFENRQAPQVLLSGDHESIRRWRRRESLRLTLQRRPELLAQAALTEEDERLLAELKAESEA